MSPYHNLSSKSELPENVSDATTARPYPFAVLNGGVNGSASQYGGSSSSGDERDQDRDRDRDVKQPPEPTPSTTLTFGTSINPRDRISVVTAAETSSGTSGEGKEGILMEEIRRLREELAIAQSSNGGRRNSGYGEPPPPVYEA
jgi:hypothetical protein